MIFKFDFDTGAFCIPIAACWLFRCFCRFTIVHLCDRSSLCVSFVCVLSPSAHRAARPEEGVLGVWGRSHPPLPITPIVNQH